MAFPKKVPVASKEYSNQYTLLRFTQQIYIAWKSYLVYFNCFSSVSIMKLICFSLRQQMAPLAFVVNLVDPPANAARIPILVLYPVWLCTGKIVKWVSQEGPIIINFQRNEKPNYTIRIKKFILHLNPKKIILLIKKPRVSELLYTLDALWDTC